MQSPSNSQLKAIKHGCGTMLVLAGPGSGKTFVMTQRILNLIQEKHIKPEHILVISFSKASTLELEQRFQRHIQEQIIETSHFQIQNNIQYNLNEIINDNNQVNFYTFHACFFHILKDTYHYTSKDIITEKQKRELIRTVVANPKLEEEKVEEYLQKISYYKNQEKYVLKDKESKEFQQIFQEYNKEMHFQHKLDFDDMGLLCLQLFLSRPEILEKWQEKFQYILIDEFQDINMIQFKVIQLLARKYQNLFVVGDDDQSIYGFRAANPKIMLDFEKYYPGTSKVLLETNYRCSEGIVKEALKVIEVNKIRFKKEIVAANRSKTQEHNDVIYQGFENYQKEYAYIGEQICKLVKEKGISYSDIACIFRTNQDMTGLAEYFARNKIPFVMKETCNSIFQHFIAKDIIAYLQFFLEGKKRSDFIRIMNKPLRYISRSAVSALSNEVVEWKKLKHYYIGKNYMLEKIEYMENNDKCIQSLDLYGACFYIRKIIGYENYLFDYAKEQNMNKEEIVEILDFLQESTRGMNSLMEWKDYINFYEQNINNKGEIKDGIHMITMHACKGLEYPVVFLPDCNEGRVPHKKAVTAEEIEEERRMFYVAMTRAKEHLEIVYIEDKLKKHLQKSRFINRNKR